MNGKENNIIIDLVGRMAAVETKIENLTTQVTANNTIVSANTIVVSNLITAQSIEDGVRKRLNDKRDSTEKKSLTTWQKAGIIVIGVVGFSGIISSWILFIIK